MFSHVITRSFVNYHHLWLDHNLSKRKSTSCNQTWKQISRQQDYSSDNLDGLIHITRQLKVKFLTCFLTKKKRENKVWRWRCVVCLWRERGVCRFLAKHQVSDVVVVLLLVPLLLLLRLLFRAFLGVGRGVCRFLAKHQVSDGEEGIYCQTWKQQEDSNGVWRISNFDMDEYILIYAGKTCPEEMYEHKCHLVHVTCCLLTPVSF